MFRVSLIAVSVSGERGRNNEYLAVDPARSLHHGVDDDDEHDLVHGETVPLVQTTWTTDGEFSSDANILLFLCLTLGFD